MVDLHRFLGFELSGLPRSVNFLLTLFPTESSATTASNSLKPKHINFKAKFLTTFDPFYSALIGALGCPLATVLCLVFDDTFGLTLLCGVFLAGVVPDTAAPRDTERLFCSVASSSGFVSSAGLPLLAFQKPTGLDQDDAACLEAFDCYRRMRPPDAAIHAVRLSPHLEAAQHLLKRPSLPSSRLLCLPLTCNRLCQKAAPPPGLP